VLNYFKDIYVGMSTAIDGMAITLRNMLKKPVTQNYPHITKPVIETYRGFQSFDVDTCIACNLCVKICPVDCIELDAERVKVGGKLTAFLTHYEINFETCMFCGLCEEVCPPKCVVMGPDHQLLASAIQREDGRLIKEYVDRDGALKKVEAAKKQAALEAAAAPAPAVATAAPATEKPK
jgi:NADH-quinone oxidoreductase subunit I